MAFTNNFRFEIPNRGEYPGQWDIPMNANFVKIDNILKSISNNFASTTQPLLNDIGSLWYDISNSLLLIKKGSGYKVLIDSENLLEYIGGTPIFNDGIIPQIPNGLAANYYIDFNKQITLYAIRCTWNQVVHDDLDGYLIAIQTQGDTAIKEYFVQDPLTEYIFTNILPNKTYYIKIRSIDKQKNYSNYSSPITVSIGQDTIAPSAPTSVIATAGIKKIILKWNKPPESDVYGYEVHASQISGFTPDCPVNAPSPKTSTTLKYEGQSTFISIDVDSATTYYIKVRSYDYSGNYSVFSSQIQCTTGKIVSSDIADDAINTQHIVDNAINEYKIAQNAITTDKLLDEAITAEKIAFGAIISEKLIITDFVNLVPNPTFRTGDNTEWEGISNTKVISNTNSEVPEGSISEYIGVLDVLTTKNEALTPSGTFNWIDVVPGDKFYISAYAASSLVVNQELKIGAKFIQSDGITTTEIIASQISQNSTWDKYGEQIIVPDGFHHMKFLIYTDGNISPSGKWYFSNASIRHVSGATLIEDGAITTNKIAVGAITAESAIIANGAIKEAHIADASIVSAKIKNGEIYEAKIANGAITNAKIGEAAVDTANIADAAIVTAKIGDAQITSAKIDSVEASKIDAIDLSAISADLGNITAGRVVLTGSNQYIRAGQATYDSGQGFWIGTDGTGITKLSIGNSLSGKLTWDGNQLKIIGDVLIGSITVDEIASKDDVSHSIVITSTGGNIFKNGIGQTVLVANVYHANIEVDNPYKWIQATQPSTEVLLGDYWLDTSNNTSKICTSTSPIIFSLQSPSLSYVYRWKKWDKDGNLISDFGGPGINYKTGKSIIITGNDVLLKATFQCEIE